MPLGFVAARHLVSVLTVCGRRHARLSVAVVSVRDIRDSMDNGTSKKKPFSVEAARERSLSKVCRLREHCLD